MNIHYNSYPHIPFGILLKEMDMSDTFEGLFNEYYTPAPQCSIGVYIPTDDEIVAWDWEVWQLAMFAVLLGFGFTGGDTVYLDIDY